MVIIIGAGISGLSAAWHLQKAGIEYVLLELSDKPGGYIQSFEKDGCILESGPNSLLCDEEILSFIHETGADTEMIESAPVSNARFILKNGHYQQLPDKPPLLLLSNFFSLSTKMKVLREFFSPVQNIPNETLAHFFERRFGREIVNYALNPFITGIYAGDPDQLLVDETFPILKEYENTYGSVLKGLIKNKPVERKKSVNFKGGLATLPNKIAQKLASLKYNHEVLALKKENNQFVVSGRAYGNQNFEFKADYIVLTSPTSASSQCLKELHPKLSSMLEEIEYSPMVAVQSVYKRNQIGHSLNGFGALNPSIEKQFTAGCIWTSSVFPYKTPADKFLFTSFVGGTLNKEKTELPEEEIKQKTHEELSNYFKIHSKPDFQEVIKWKKAIPQYNTKIKAIKEPVSELENQRLYVISNWYKGVSLSDCIKKGKNIAEKIANFEVQ